MLINVIASLQTPSLDISSEVELKFNHNLQEISKWKIQAFLKFSSVLVCGYEKCFQLKCSWNFPSWCHITEALPSLRAYLLQKKNPFISLVYFLQILVVHLPPSIFLLPPVSSLRFLRSPFEDGARRVLAWIALDTKGGLFHEMFPFLMSDGVRSFNIPHRYLSGSWLRFKATAWL